MSAFCHLLRSVIMYLITLRYLVACRFYCMALFHSQKRHHRSRYNNIQLLTIEALDMMWYRPESTNIGRGGAEVNIGILRLISYHVQCLNSQQLFYYIISLNKKATTTTTKSWLWTMSSTVLNFFLFTLWPTDFIQLKEEWMHTLFVITTADREDPG